jgi:hypothetical protein
LPVITWRHIIQSDCREERERLKHELAVLLKAFDHARKVVIFSPHLRTAQLRLDDPPGSKFTPTNQNSHDHEDHDGVGAMSSRPPSESPSKVECRVAADVHNEELGMLYSFVFMLWRLNSQILNATRDSESSLRRTESVTPEVSTQQPPALKQRVAAFWSKKTSQLDEASAKVALRLSITVIVASLFALVPALRKQFDYSFWVAVSGSLVHSV